MKQKQERENGEQGSHSGVSVVASLISARGEKGEKKRWGKAIRSAGYGPGGFKDSLDLGFCGGGVEIGRQGQGERQRAQGQAELRSGQDDWRS